MNYCTTRYSCSFLRYLVTKWPFPRADSLTKTLRTKTWKVYLTRLLEQYITLFCYSRPVWGPNPSFYDRLPCYQRNPAWANHASIRRCGRRKNYGEECDAQWRGRGPWWPRWIIAWGVLRCSSHYEIFVGWFRHRGSYVRSILIKRAFGLIWW